MNKVQVNIYAAGLHRQGSGAVHRYTMMELADRFALMNVAFDQEDFRVDECLDFLCKEKIPTLQNWSKTGHFLQYNLRVPESNAYFVIPNKARKPTANRVKWQTMFGIFEVRRRKKPKALTLKRQTITTRKETLLARKYELQNTLRILRGEDPYDQSYVGREGVRFPSGVQNVNRGLSRVRTRAIKQTQDPF